MGIMLGNAVCNKGYLWRGRGCFSFGMNYDQLIRVMGESTGMSSGGKGEVILV